MGSNFKNYLQERNQLDSGPPACYHLPLTRVNMDGLPDNESKIKKFTLGKKNPEKQNKTVMFVGATGTGKSTLINALVNYVMGVKFEDKVWFEMIEDESDRPQSESQTSEVSVYEVFGFEGVTVPYSLTIIDTPGYGDTRGMKYDDMVTEKLFDLFCIPNEIKNIDAVGLVLKASENRLDDRMAYIFNSVMSPFGKDMEKNIVAMITYSDGMEPTNALQALDEAKIKCARNKNKEPVNFLFNNRQKERTEEKRALTAAQFAFDISTGGMKNFTDFLRKIQPQSTKQCVEVMEERNRLTACINNLKERVTDIEKQEKAINNNKQQLKKFEEEIKKNKDFTISKQVTYKDKTTTKDKALTCPKCEENCHNPCTTAITKWWCNVMTWGGKCTACSRKCSHGEHVREKFIYETKTITIKTTAEAMKAEYDRNKSEHKKTTSLLEDMEEDLIEKNKEKNTWLNEAFEYIVQLEKIALNKDAVSTIAHLAFLIEKMKVNEDIKMKVEKLLEMKYRVDEKVKKAAEYYEKSKKDKV